MKQILLFFTLLGVFASCGGNTSGGSGNGDAPKPIKPISFGGVTLTVSHRNVTELDVEFYGRADFEESYTNAEFGVAYSTSPDFTIDDAEKLLITNISGTDYSVSASWLTPGTTYYYASFIKKDKVCKCSEVSSFKTVSLVAPALNDASNIKTVSATISGKVCIPSKTPDDFEYDRKNRFRHDYEDLFEYGFEYCTSQDFTSNVTTNKVTDLDSEDNFSVELSSLISNQTYYYRSYIMMRGVTRGVTVYSEPKSFMTLPTPYDIQKDLNISSATDLSSSGSANCYIVSESGTYKFKTVKGNSSTSVDSVASASVLWETFGTSTAPEMLDLISAFCYKDGYIAFQTADTFKEGNAVIAAKDTDGNILWSWHIWLTDQPEGQEYYNNAGTMMDRNLGATSATPGDVGALGLLYQWGRKDPFLGSSSISDNVTAKSTISWPSTVKSTSSTGTISYATAHPTTYITYNSSNNYDWYYTGSSSTDNTRWTTSDKSKSIYDPCPVGWRVPDGGFDGVWSKAKGSSSRFDHTYNSTNEGMNFSGQFGSASTIWYPAFDDFGGSYWSASPFSYSSYSAYSLCFSDLGGVNPAIGYSIVSCSSVRCIQE